MKTKLTLLATAVATAAIGAGTALADSTATVTVTNHGSEPLFLNATYSTLQAEGSTTGPQMIQANGGTGTYTVDFNALDFGPGQVWLFRWGGSDAFVGVSAVFGSGNEDVQCGWTDANAGYDGYDLDPWESGCDSYTQPGTGGETIIGTADAYNPPGSYSFEACTASDPPWANASDTGVQLNVNNSQSQTLNLVWGLVALDKGDSYPPFPPPDGAPPASPARVQGGFGPPLGEYSPLADSWQDPPAQFIGGDTNGVNFCAYDATTAVGGSNTGTYFSVLYQIGSSQYYLKLQASDPIVGSNDAECDITDASGNPLSGPYGVDCGIQHGSGIHSVWHAVAWVTLWQNGGGGATRSVRAGPAPAIDRPSQTWPAAQSAAAGANAPRVVATVRRNRLSRKAYRAAWAHRAAAARSTALMQLTGDTTHDECTRAVAAHAAAGTSDAAAQARRFCATVGRPAPVGRRGVKREALNSLIISRWIALEARRRGIRASQARLDRRMAAIRRGAGSRFSALLREANVSRGELRRQVRLDLLAERLRLTARGVDDHARAGRAVRRLYEHWRPQTRCRPRFFVGELCGRRLRG
jgi:SurA N-terminal domain